LLKLLLLLLLPVLREVVMLLVEVVGDADAQLFSIQGTNDSSTWRVPARGGVVAAATAATGTTGSSAHCLVGAAAGVQRRKRKERS